MFLSDGEQVIFTTVTTTSYLPQAITMAKSVKKHMPNSKVIACVIEEQIPNTSETLNTYFDGIVLAKDLGFQNFYQFMFQYHQHEGCNACKAQLLIYLLETYKSHNYFIFLDSDTKVFGPFNELVQGLATNEILISPHLIYSNEENLFYHLAIAHGSGIFNTGFFAIKRGNESYKFLDWWTRILSKYCYMDTNMGIWNEQKWLDLAIGLFDFYIQKEPGYNVGPWNFHERCLSLSPSGEYMVNGRSLRLFHFSGLYYGGKYFTDRMNQTNPDQKVILDELRREYTQELREFDKDSLRATSWSYYNFSDGSPIDHKSRLILRESPDRFRDIDNPFLKNNRFFSKNTKRKK